PASVAVPAAGDSAGVSSGVAAGDGVGTTNGVAEGRRVACAAGVAPPAERPIGKCRNPPTTVPSTAPTSSSRNCTDALIVAGRLGGPSLLPTQPHSLRRAMVRAPH